jgi:hypothetical protein
LRDGSEVEVEGPATQTFGPRFVFEKLGPPSYTRIRDTDKRKGFVEREGAYTRFHFYDFLFISSGTATNDFYGSESRYLYDTLDLIYIFLDTRILVDLIILDSQHRIIKRNHNRSCSIRHLHGVWNIPLHTSVQFQLRPIVPHLRHRP